MKYLIIVTLACFFVLTATAQSKIIVGTIKDQHSDEPVPFASIQFKLSQRGIQADSSGGFVLQIPAGTKDTLEITSVGYQDYSIEIDASTFGDTLKLRVQMIPGKYTAEVVIRKKVNRGLQMCKRIVAHKKFNDRYRFQNFSYELYNKLELDLKNIDRERLANSKLFRPFNFILENIDTSEGVPVLPAYLTEAISNYYYQKNPLK